MRTKFLSLIVFISAGILHAQIPNNSFELNNHCNLSAYWSYMPLQVIIIDSLGPHSDSIIWDGEPYLTYPDSDAHTGNLAISIRNAYSYTNSYTLTGHSMLYPDSSECTSFFQTMLPINTSPQTFSFYYKYAPLNGDTAYAIAAVYDQFGTEVGRAEKLIIGAQSTYVHEVVPFSYILPDSVAYYSISFHNQIPDGYPHQNTLGTRLLIDDVSLEEHLSIENNEDIKISVFPNPATESFTIQPAANVTVENISLINSQGQVVQCIENGTCQYNSGNLANGIYQLKITTDKGMVYKKLIKN